MLNATSHWIINLMNLIHKGLFTFTYLVTVGVPHGVLYSSDDEEEDVEANDNGGMCAGCGNYECEC